MSKRQKTNTLCFIFILLSSLIMSCMQRKGAVIKSMVDVKSLEHISNSDFLASEGFINSSVLVACKDGSIEALNAEDFNQAIRGQHPICEQKEGSALDIKTISGDDLKRQSCIDWARVNTLDVHDSHRDFSQMSFNQTIYYPTSFTQNWYHFDSHGTHNEINVSLKVNSSHALKAFIATGCNTTFLSYSDQIYTLEKSRLDVLEAWRQAKYQLAKQYKIQLDDDKVEMENLSGMHGKPTSMGSQYANYQKFLQGHAFCTVEYHYSTNAGCPWLSWDSYIKSFPGLTQENIMFFNNNSWKEYEAYAQLQMSIIERKFNRSVTEYSLNSKKNLPEWEKASIETDQKYFNQVLHLNNLIRAIHKKVESSSTSNDLMIKN